MLNLLQNHHTIFHSGCIIFHSHYQGLRILFAPHPHQTDNIFKQEGNLVVKPFLLMKSFLETYYSKTDQRETAGVEVIVHLRNPLGFEETQFENHLLQVGLLYPSWLRI